MKPQRFGPHSEPCPACGHSLPLEPEDHDYGPATPGFNPLAIDPDFGPPCPVCGVAERMNDAKMAQTIARLQAGAAARTAYATRLGDYLNERRKSAGTAT